MNPDCTRSEDSATQEALFLAAAPLGLLTDAAHDAPSAPVHTGGRVGSRWGRGLVHTGGGGGFTLGERVDSHCGKRADSHWGKRADSHWVRGHTGEGEASSGLDSPVTAALLPTDPPAALRHEAA